MKEEVDLRLEYPSIIATLLMNNKIDVGLVPVTIIPEMKDHYIISDYCIGCDGEVGSVCLFSEVPLEKIETILMDYQSRSSVELLKILVKEYWKINVTFLDATEDYQANIQDTTAGLVIGDRAFSQRKISPYIYDLGLAWKIFTGLPFVFAAWVSNKKLDSSFIRAFNKANLYGLNHLDEVIASNRGKMFDLRSYYTHYIKYNMDDEKRDGMNFFLQKLTSVNYADNDIV